MQRMKLHRKKALTYVFLCIGMCALALGTQAQEKNEDIRVGYGVICLNVQDREPVGVDTSFSSDAGLLYCFTRIEGATDSTSVTHLWYYGQRKVSVTTLPVKSSRWRTFSKKEINPEWTGKWHVVILSEAGDPLAQLSFFIRAPKPE